MRNFTGGRGGAGAGREEGGGNSCRAPRGPANCRVKFCIRAWSARAVPGGTFSPRGGHHPTACGGKIGDPHCQAALAAHSCPPARAPTHPTNHRRKVLHPLALTRLAIRCSIPFRGPLSVRSARSAPLLANDGRGLRGRSRGSRGLRGRRGSPRLARVGGRPGVADGGARVGARRAGSAGTPPVSAQGSEKWLLRSAGSGTELVRAGL